MAKKPEIITANSKPNAAKQGQIKQTLRGSGLTAQQADDIVKGDLTMDEIIKALAAWTRGLKKAKAK